MFYKVNKNNSVSLVLEKEDCCSTCRYSGSTKLTPCGFIAAILNNLIPAVPEEDSENDFILTQCGAYCLKLKEVNNEHC